MWCVIFSKLYTLPSPFTTRSGVAKYRLLLFFPLLLDLKYLNDVKKISRIGRDNGQLKTVLIGWCGVFQFEYKTKAWQLYYVGWTKLWYRKNKCLRNEKTISVFSFNVQWGTFVDNFSQRVKLNSRGYFVLKINLERPSMIFLLTFCFKGWAVSFF